MTAPTHDHSTGITSREPVVAIVTAAVVLLNAVLTVAFSFVALDPGQVAAIYGLANPLGAFLAAVLARGRSTPWEPIDLPAHADASTYSLADLDETPNLPEGW